MVKPTSSYLLIFALFLATVTAQTTSTARTCITKGYYDCSKCPCNYTSSDLIPTLFISVSLILIAILQIICFVAIPGLRKKPGDILCGLAVADIIYACGKIVSAYTYSNARLIDDANNGACLASGLIYTFANGMLNFYHVVYFAYYLGVLRFSLKGSVPGFMYHLGVVILSFMFLFGVYSSDTSGRNVYGLCEIKTAPGLWMPLLSTLGILIIIYLFAYFTRKYMPNNEKIKELRDEFINYYTRYVVVVSALYFLTLIYKIVHGLIMNQVATGSVTTGALVSLNITKVLADILSCGSPLVQLLVRFGDPIVQRHWNQVMALYYKAAPSRMMSETLTEALTSNSAMDLEMSNSQLCHVKEFQQSRRIQVLYSVLAGIHYFWHVKEMNKLIELSPLKIDSESKEEDKSEVEKESKSMRTLMVHKDTLTKQIPELFKQIQDQHYNLEKGTLIAYAPRVFDEIINLDDVGRGIRKSLDLTDNFQRILKSGVNGGGKSGEFFFFSDDNKFIVKTVSESELQVFREILPQYARYLAANPKSMITKMYGLFTFKVNQPSETYNLILMGNINGFPSNCVERKYDLKGSTVGRIAIKDESVTMEDLKDKGVLKDLDFDKFEQKIHIESQEKKDLIETLRKDIQFLSSMELVDYSLALYIIDRKKRFDNLAEGQAPSAHMLEAENLDAKVRAFHTFKSTQEDVYYHIGIIDYLIQFNLKKQSEVFFKKLGAMDRNLDISVQKPEYYGERFVKYMEKILAE